MKDRVAFVTSHPWQLCCTTTAQMIGCSGPIYHSLHTINTGIEEENQNVRMQFGNSLTVALE